MVKDDAERQRCVERMKEYDVKALLHPKDMFRDGPYSSLTTTAFPHTMPPGTKWEKATEHASASNGYNKRRIVCRKE